MEIFILDEKFRAIYDLDVFESLIWTERYNGCGNFEFYIPIGDFILEVINTIQKKMESKLECYAWLKDSQTSMIIEDIQITTDVETGNHLVMSGRGLESLLDRRIIWEQTNLNGDLQNGVKKLLNDAIINPKIADRKISNFIFSPSNDTYIKGLSIKAQYTGDNLYDTMLKICDTYKLGFDVSLDSNNKFVFSLTVGKDRSYDQSQNPYVVFSPKFENIINSDFLESSKTLKNVSLVAGEDSGSARRTKIVGSGKGLARREIFTDARDIQSETADGTLTDAEYNELLKQRGLEDLSENIYTKAFTGEIEATKTFVYGSDFFKGDVVQIINEYGMESRVRVSEVVRVQDTNGYTMYPTFEVIE